MVQQWRRIGLVRLVVTVGLVWLPSTLAVNEVAAQTAPQYGVRFQGSAVADINTHAVQDFPKFDSQLQATRGVSHSLAAVAATTDGSANAAISGTAGLGNLYGSATANASSVADTVGFMKAEASAGATLDWFDTLTLQSSTVPAGTPAQVLLSLGLTSTVTAPSNFVCNPSLPQVQASLSTNRGGALLLADTQCVHPTNRQQQVVVTVPVGGQLVVNGELKFSAGASASFGTTVSAGATDVRAMLARIEVVTPGVTYTSASGVDYSTNDTGSLGPFPILFPPIIGPDSEPPNTSISSAVDDSGTPVTDNTVTASQSVTFSFAGTDNVGVISFGCSLDGASFTTCTSPTTYAGLSDGDHTFQVRARDGAGNVDPTPTGRTWSVDRVSPDTSITSAVDANGSAVASGGSTVSTAINVAFTGTDNTRFGVGFECSLDGAAFAICLSPRQYPGLAVGGHTLRVRAKDVAGNVDATPAQFAWNVVTPAQGVTNLISVVNGLTLPEGANTSLTASLDNAAKKLTDGVPANDSAACDSLSQFELKVTDQVRAGRLSTQQGAALVSAADAIERALGCP